MNSVCPPKNSPIPLADVNLCMHALPSLIPTIHACMTTVYFYRQWHIILYSAILDIIIIIIIIVKFPVS